MGCAVAERAQVLPRSLELGSSWHAHHSASWERFATTAIRGRSAAYAPRRLTTTSAALAAGGNGWAGVVQASWQLHARYARSWPLRRRLCISSHAADGGGGCCNGRWQGMHCLARVRLAFLLPARCVLAAFPVALRGRSTVRQRASDCAGSGATLVAAWLRKSHTSWPAASSCRSFFRSSCASALTPAFFTRLARAMRAGSAVGCSACAPCAGVTQQLAVLGLPRHSAHQRSPRARRFSAAKRAQLQQEAARAPRHQAVE